MTHILFFGLMALSSAISILKMAVLAAVLPPSEFAYYASTFALVGMAASAISFGLTDGSVKRVVRMFEFGRIDELRSALRKDNGTLLKRHLVASLLAIGAAAAAYGPWSVLPALAVVLLAYTTNLFTLVSSLFHGMNLLVGLALANITRALSATMVASVAAVAVGWEFSLLAEGLISVFVSAALLLWLLNKLGRRRSGETVDKESHISTSQDGFRLFLASTAALIPISFDRLWVTHFAPGLPAAQYAFAVIWVVAAFTATSVYIQKFGPDAIRYRANGGTESLARLALLHSFLMSSILLIFTASSFVVLYYFLYDLYWVKFKLSAPFVCAVTVVSCLQVNRRVDWALIPLDGELGVLISSIAFALVTAASFAFVAWVGGSVTAYLIGFGLARLTQIVVGLVWLYGLERPRGRM